jgi:DNA-binding response OmpR family regulator
MGNVKILLVEDDADTLLGYQVLLKASHYDTTFAGDSLTAASEAHRFQPDLIILDLGLPAGDWQGDGFVILERFRASADLSHIPTIVVSARDPHVNKHRALAAGASAYLQKPMDNAQLLATIKQVLRHPVAIPQPR